MQRENQRRGIERERGSFASVLGSIGKGAGVGAGAGLGCCWGVRVGTVSAWARSGGRWVTALRGLRTGMERRVRMGACPASCAKPFPTLRMATVGAAANVLDSILGGRVVVGAVLGLRLCGASGRKDGEPLA